MDISYKGSLLLLDLDNVSFISGYVFSSFTFRLILFLIYLALELIDPIIVMSSESKLWAFLS